MDVMELDGRCFDVLCRLGKMTRIVFSIHNIWILEFSQNLNNVVLQISSQNRGSSIKRMSGGYFGQQKVPTQCFNIRKACARRNNYPEIKQQRKEALRDTAYVKLFLKHQFHWSIPSYFLNQTIGRLIMSLGTNRAKGNLSKNAQLKILATACLKKKLIFIRKHSNQSKKIKTKNIWLLIALAKSRRTDVKPKR